MEEDAKKLHEQVFLESFLVLAQSPVLDLSVREAFGYGFRRLGHWLIDVYGRERWPLAPVLYWSFQRSLQQRRRLRGLAPYRH
jgi:hypothetical protein